MKRGQVAIFVIVAVIIIGVVAALFFIPQTRISLPGAENRDPASFMRQCLEEDFKNSIGEIATQGGSSNPELFTLYEDGKVEYLCYTSENYVPCVVQRPLLVSHMESEIKESLKDSVKSCLGSLKSEFEGRGFNVNYGNGEYNVSLIPGRIAMNFEQPVTIEGENVQTFRSFSLQQESEMYNLLLIATSILDFESSLGDSETSLYIQYYPDLKIEKLRRDADKIYTLSNVETGEKFRFATRSLVWPSGYGGQ